MYFQIQLAKDQNHLTRKSLAKYQVQTYVSDLLFPAKVVTMVLCDSQLKARRLINSCLFSVSYCTVFLKEDLREVDLELLSESFLVYVKLGFLCA